MELGWEAVSRPWVIERRGRSRILKANWAAKAALKKALQLTQKASVPAMVHLIIPLAGVALGFCHSDWSLDVGCPREEHHADRAAVALRRSWWLALTTFSIWNNTSSWKVGPYLIGPPEATHLQSTFLLLDIQLFLLIMDHSINNINTSLFCQIKVQGRFLPYHQRKLANISARSFENILSRPLALSYHHSALFTLPTHHATSFLSIHLCARQKIAPLLKAKLPQN